MSAELKKSREDIKKYGEGLENRVKERTKSFNQRMKNLKNSIK